MRKIFSTRRRHFRVFLLVFICILLFVDVVFIFVLDSDVRRRNDLLDQSIELETLEKEIDQYTKLAEEYRAVSSENQSLVSKKEELQKELDELNKKKESLNYDIDRLNRLIKEEG